MRNWYDNYQQQSVKAAQFALKEYCWDVPRFKVIQSLAEHGILYLTKDQMSAFHPEIEWQDGIYYCGFDIVHRPRKSFTFYRLERTL